MTEMASETLVRSYRLFSTIEDIHNIQADRRCHLLEGDGKPRPIAAREAGKDSPRSCWLTILGAKG